MKNKICWVTASYFLDVDLPVIPLLRNYYDIDWYVVTSEANNDDDINYIQTSQPGMKFEIIRDNSFFFSPSHFKSCKALIDMICRENYDLYYFDISDLLFLFPLIYRNLPIEKIIIATHNVSVPKGARYAPLARRSMKYILKHFNNFQTFSLNQQDFLLSLRPDANVLYAPLMLKDYGTFSNSPTPDFKERVNFLFFGNIVKYKRLDVLLKAVDILYNRNYRNFKVYICGYSTQKKWEQEYLPLIRHPELFHLDIRRIPSDKVGKYFNLAHYFVMPYQDIAQSGAMTVALNYNLPVIASDLPTFHEFITPDYDSYMFEAAKPEALADKMEKAINNSREEYYVIKENLRTTVEDKLSPKSIISKYRDYIDKLLKK